MDPSEPPSAASRPAPIAGIYDYCDRWCERCAFAHRCAVHASTHDAESHAGGDPLLTHLQARFDVVIAARGRTGMETPTASLAAVPPGPPRPREDERRRHPLLREGRAYAALVDAWFETEAGTFRTHADDLAARAEAGALWMLPDPAELRQLLDAVAVVRSDGGLIPVKIARALHGAADTDRAAGAIQTDSNGSAKVALLAIERSEAAWRLMDRWLPVGSAGLLADQLASLRGALEAAFPAARRFRRPGFDGPPPIDDGV